MGKLTFHIAPGHWAGHMRIYHRICKCLHSASYGVSLAANGGEETIQNRGIEVRSLGKWSPGSNGSRLAERIRRCRQAYAMASHSQADIFTFYSLEFLPWASSLKRKRHVPIVFDCMEDFEAYALQKQGIPKAIRRPLSWLIGASLRNVSRRIDAVIVSDAGTAKRFERFARRVVLIHNFPELELFKTSETAEAVKNFDLTYHGSLPIYHLRKCLAIDDALVSRNRRLKWRFIGRLPQRDWFKGELAKRGAADRFHFLDLVPHDRVAAEVSQAKIGIIPLPDLPKFQTNIPQKLFEFMALQMPAVLSDLPPSRPFVGDGRCAFLVNPDDPGAYADAIIRLVEDVDLRRQMGLEGRKRVEDHYNWARESIKLVGLYQELLR